MVPSQTKRLTLTDIIYYSALKAPHTYRCHPLIPIVSAASDKIQKQYKLLQLSHKPPLARCVTEMIGFLTVIERLEERKQF